MLGNAGAKKDDTQPRYTDEQIAAALKRYRERVDSVMPVFHLAPDFRGNAVNVSDDFLMVNYFLRQIKGQTLSVRQSERIAVCRELYLSENPGEPADKPLADLFVDITLSVENEPFVLIVYDEPSFAHTRQSATTLQEFPKSYLMRTARNVPFYLCREADLNNIFPLRFEYNPIPGQS